MRVLIVDDSAFMRRAISNMLAKAPEIEIVATARNGREALELIQSHRPDVVTLDIEMPEMDGLTALRHIMRNEPQGRPQVLMLSSLTTEGSHAALRALKLGAADVLAKDTSQFSLSIGKIESELLAKVRVLAKTSNNQRPSAAEPCHTSDLASFQPRQFDVVCVGSSTGGPPVLETILAALPAHLKVPIVVAQHMPALFTESMAERLDQLCALKVIHAQNGQILTPGHVYVAPGGQHTHLKRIGVARWKLRVDDQPQEAIYRPSVDALFHSAADATASRTLAILLTGMGSDGTDGAARIHQQGGTIIAQTQETCVVYGMPKAVTERGFALASLSPESIGATLAAMATRA